MITKDIKIYTLRINADLFKILEEVAKQNKRSIAKEIEYSLEQIYKNKTI